MESPGLAEGLGSAVQPGALASPRLSPRSARVCGQAADCGGVPQRETAGGVSALRQPRKWIFSSLLPRSSTCGSSRTCEHSASLGTPLPRQRITRCSSGPTFLTSCTWTPGVSMTTWQVSPSRSPSSARPSSGPLVSWKGTLMQRERAAPRPHSFYLAAERFQQYPLGQCGACSGGQVLSTRCP